MPIDSLWQVKPFDFHRLQWTIAHSVETDHFKKYICKQNNLPTWIYIVFWISEGKKTFLQDYASLQKFMKYNNPDS